MTKSVIAPIAVVCVLGLALALNPSAERHRTKIRDAVAERSELEKMLGVGEFTAFASKYHSVYVGSYTTVSDKVVSVGAFGMVFVSE